MAQFILQGRLKLLLNSDNPAQLLFYSPSLDQAEEENIERPVNVVCWKRAICLEFTEKADVLEYYDQTVNSPNGSFNIPAVLRVPHLLQVMKRKKVRNVLSRKNIFYRDDYMCQYCKVTNNLTIDHVVPIARGGKWEWENLVLAVEIKLLILFPAPKDYDILAIPLTSATVRMLKIKKGTPQQWRQYLPK
uniref:HNH nuclease domain-containing protein n=1 Tax=Chenopodium quinoa TaxID=63459 RepID=A0A803MMB1_CHEQI